MWIKYKHGFASGQDREWSYQEFNGYNLKDDLEEAVEYIESEYDWSDKYRGIEYEVVDLPPKSVIADEIKSIESSISNLKVRLLRYNDVLSKM